MCLGNITKPQFMPGSAECQQHLSAIDGQALQSTHQITHYVQVAQDVVVLPVRSTVHLHVLHLRPGAATECLMSASCSMLRKSKTSLLAWRLMTCLRSS